MRGRLKPFTALTLVFIHGVAGYTLWKCFHGGFSAAAWWTFGLMWAVNVLSITVVYHRYATHESFKVFSPFFEKILYALPTCAFQGDGIWWGETHWRHHVYADVEGDPHRPTEFGGGLKGFLWAHAGWIFFELAPAPSPEYRPSPHFRESAGLRWQKKYYLPLGIALGLGVPYLLAGWDGLLLAGFLRTALCLNLAWSVNSFCHAIGALAEDSSGHKLETRRARNFPLHCLLNILAVLSGGEFWHANHHARPRSALLGWESVQFDPGGRIVKIGAALGLFHDVGQPNI
jgi:stearoyl-CoA desaturase (delta-9 desaturase)